MAALAPPNLVTGCDVFFDAVGDLDYDGTSYCADWPTSTTPNRWPSTFQQLSPTSRGHAVRRHAVRDRHQRDRGRLQPGDRGRLRDAARRGRATSTRTGRGHASTAPACGSSATCGTATTSAPNASTDGSGHTRWARSRARSGRSPRARDETTHSWQPRSGRDRRSGSAGEPGEPAPCGADDLQEHRPRFPYRTRASHRDDAPESVRGNRTDSRSMGAGSGSGRRPTSPSGFR